MQKRQTTQTDSDSSEDDDAFGSSDDDFSQSSDTSSYSNDGSLDGWSCESDADEDDSDLVKSWAANAYAPSTQGEFARLYNRFLSWIEELPQDVRTACQIGDGAPEKPFSRYLSASLFVMICRVHIHFDCRKLCVLYLNSESKRLTTWFGGMTEKRRLGGGTLTNV
jgi:hypothetical protein